MQKNHGFFASLEAAENRVKRVGVFLIGEKIMFTQKHVSTKKGFTLIELMVVIVIIGILAAIAIPKLFGMTAKAKASEVTPAAGTWSKMYMAWAMEAPKPDSGGTWKAIAYKGPGDPDSTGTSSNTPNFKYSDGEKNGEWKAVPVSDLNDCKSGGSSFWSGKFNSGTSESPTMTVSGSGCEQLTPSFCKIGTCTTTAQTGGGGNNNTTE